MGAYTKAKSHLSREEVMEKIKNTRGFREMQKLLVIYNAIVDPRPAGEIALHTGLARQTVHNMVSEYNRTGEAFLKKPGRGGRRKAYLTPEEEQRILKRFEALAFTGQVATAAGIQTAFEKCVGHEVSRSTVYRMMQRHGWRKVMPRPTHVDKKPEEQEIFKKNSRHRFGKSSHPYRKKTHGR